MTTDPPIAPYAAFRWVAPYVFLVHEVKKASLDDDTQREIREALFGKWSDDLRAQMKIEIVG